jgi:hypothetical protein
MELFRECFWQQPLAGPALTLQAYMHKGCTREQYPSSAGAQREWKGRGADWFSAQDEGAGLSRFAAEGGADFPGGGFCKAICVSDICFVFCLL